VSIAFFLKDMCNDSLKANDWEVVDKYGTKLKMSKNGSFELYKGEKYFVAIEYYRGIYLKLINFTYQVVAEQKSDSTIVIPKIVKLHEGSSVNFEERYFNCNQLCNGHCIDYYINGERRMEGNFSDGKPIGKLIFYNKDGKVDYIEIYSKNGKLRKIMPRSKNPN
jgi:antitoxin component YwqK of YwqJK toxin-antitoxin module